MAIRATINDTQFHVGDTVQVHYRLIEKEKVAGKAKRETKEEIRERIQIFEGIVLGIRGEGVNCSFTVRRIGAGAIGIERVFPVFSPWIKAITVKKHAVVRRAKIYYLREKTGKAATKLKEFKDFRESAKKASKKPVKAEKSPKTETAAQ